MKSRLGLMALVWLSMLDPPAPTNPPQALDTLMQYWKAQLTPQKLYSPLVVKLRV